MPSCNALSDHRRSPLTKPTRTEVLQNPRLRPLESRDGVPEALLSLLKCEEPVV